MKPLMGLLLLAVPVLFLAAQARAGCPGGPDCIWVDQGACGECVSNGSDCTTDGDCSPGTCSGVCSLGGSTPCVGDEDCQSSSLGFCTGTCANGVTACFGDAGCAICIGSTPGAGTEVSPYCTLDEAYLAAFDGDTIYVGPGTYEQCADLYGGSLPVPEDRAVHVLARAFDASGGDPDTIGDTTLDGTGICPGEPVVTLFASGASMTGMTVTGGEDSGLFISGSVAISSNRITGNSSNTGGGIFVYPASCYYNAEATISITDNEISDNQAIAGPLGDLDQDLGDGGGIGVLVVEPLGGSCNSVVDVDIRDNTIFGNRIENKNTVDGVRLIAKGGGIYVVTAMEPGGTVNVNIEDNHVFDNGRTAATLASAGGGIFVSTDQAGFGAESILVEGNTIGPDNVVHEGGGIAAWASSRLAGQHSISVEKNRIIDNTAVSTSGEGAGGGASLRVEAIDLGPGDSVRLQFRQNEVAGNLSDSSDGGGVRASFLSERSVSEPLGANTNPADEMSLIIEDNTIRDNESNVGGAGASLLVLSDSDPEFFATGNCQPFLQLPASASIEFRRNLVAGNRGVNLIGYTEVGAGILTIPSTYGEAEARVLIDETTLAGNTIGNDFESSGGLETLAFADPDCDGTLDATIVVSTDRSIVSGNDGYGIGGTPLGGSAPPGTLQVPVTNSFVHGNASGNFEPELYPVPPPSNFEVDPQLGAAFAPAACSPVFELKVCEGTTDVCQDDFDCPPEVPCLAGAGFHGNPDIAPFMPDLMIDGMDTIGLAIAFGSTDLPDPRFSALADLDHNGIVDGEDLSYMGSQFAEVCVEPANAAP